MIRRFSCDECNKQFYKAHDLSVHKRTHSKEKPYMCGTCGRAFSHVSHVIRHEKSHNNIRSFTCPVCFETFAQGNLLKAHRYRMILTLLRIIVEYPSSSGPSALLMSTMVTQKKVQWNQTKSNRFIDLMETDGKKHDADETVFANFFQTIRQWQGDEVSHLKLMTVGHYPIYR